MRCSKLPLLFDCPSSAAEGGVDSTSEAAELGTEVHRHMAAIVRGEPLPDSEDDEVRKLVYYGRKAWEELRGQAATWRAEVEEEYSPRGAKQEPTHLTGHADAVGDGEAIRIILDWKSGWKRKDASHQMMGYSLLFWGDGTPVTTVVVWLRDMEIEVLTPTGEQMAAWMDLANEKMALVGKSYIPGEHCGFCPHRNTCKARAEYVQGACVALEPKSAGTLTPAMLGSLYERSLVLQNALDTYRTALRSAVEEAPLVLPDGRVLGLREETRDEIDARKAWPVLRASGFSDDDLGSVVKVTKGKMLDLIADRTPRGKGAAKKDLMQKLEAAGAVTATVVRKLGIVKE